MNSQSSAHRILVVEDSDEDFMALMRIFKRLSVSCPVFRCVKGEDTLDFLHRQGKYTRPSDAPRPSIIILDLNLIGMDGREVLAQIKQDDILKTIPVVVLSTSSNPKDTEHCYQHGANSYLLKPVNLEKFTRAIQLLVEYWFEAVLLPDNQE